MLAPRGLLLDFHGVIAENDRTVGRDRAPLLARLVELVGDAVAPELIEIDLEAGEAAVSRWNNATARWYAPLEVSHQQFWGDFVAADWPAAARTAVLSRATELMRLRGEGGWPLSLRDGVTALLNTARTAGIPVAVVSNALFGQHFRDFVAASGLSDRFVAQIYSDEVGVRKPNPAMVCAATDAIGVAPAQTWFVGDMPNRDILAARRAGVGVAILVQTWRGPRPTDARAVADFELESMVDVHRLLADVTGA